MSERQESTVKNFSFIITILAVIASLGGIFGNIYRDDPWSTAQLIGQDVATILISVFLIFVAVSTNLKAKFIQAGVLAYFIYTYLTYAFGPKLNPLFLVYVAIIPLSILAFVFALIQIYRLLIKEESHWTFRVASLYLLAMGLMLSLLWLFDIYSYLIGEPFFKNPGGAPYQEIYALDLGIVVPACFYGGIQLLRRKQSGYIISAIMLVKSATMGLALISMTIAVYLQGYELEGVLVILWAIITVAGLILSLLLLRRFQLTPGKR